MARFRYSYGISGNSAVELSDQISRLAGLGYDAVELPANLSLAETTKVRDLVELQVSGIRLSLLTPEI